MATLEKRFWAHSLVMALLKLSPPGIMILSPTVKPDTEINKDSSRNLLPVILIPASVYSLGVFALSRAISSGSTETGCVVSESCAFTTVILKKQRVNKKTPVNKRRCIRAGFLERQIKGIN